MTISDLEFYLVDTQRAGSREAVRSMLVRLATDSGLEGWGESRVRWRGGELSARRDALLPVLAGRSVFDIEELLTLKVLQDPPLRCALEMASWDLVGQAAGQPLCHLFGGGYRQRIPLAVRLTGASDSQLAQTARELAVQGFHWQIVTSAGSFESDLEIVRAVRESVGAHVQLRLDVAGNYDPLTARELCRELEDAQVQFLIDPIRDAALPQLAALGRQTNVPLAVWRGIHDSSDVLAVARCGNIPFVVVDLEQVGGLAPARNCAAVAQAGSLSAVLASGPSLGVAVAAMLHLAASTPAFSSCNECTYYQLHDDVLTEPLEISHGMMAVPQGAGLGIEVDRAKIEKYQVA
jgi:glucarate dehydratase